ncbi:MAG: CRISPR-associated endonuclease Cas1 [Chromatiaceae bacterium]|nr:CRISPR-associated endonuclease Cas1 [Chromatiaceae bacterium]
MSGFTGTCASSLSTLLPLRALTVTLEFTAEASFGFFHQAAVYAFVGHLLDPAEKLDTHLAVDAPENGRLHYVRGSRYRFAVYALAGGEHLLARLIGRLRELPNAAPVRDAKVPLRDNVRLLALQDLFSGESVDAVQALTLYDNDRLEGEVALWLGAPHVRLRWLSPVRMLKDTDARSHAKGEARFCRQVEDLTEGLLLRRLYDATADLVRRRGGAMPARGEPPVLSHLSGHLFWVDSDYRDAAGKSHPIGGMSGEIALGPGRGLPEDWWRLLVLGQYLGIGQMRAFGMGRYMLEAPQGATTAPVAESAATLLEHAAGMENLYEAYRAIRENIEKKRPEADPDEAKTEEDWWLARYPDLPDPEEEERLADRLERLSAHLAGASYDPTALEGVVIQEKDGDLRGLAIPPFWDRVAQRALTQVVAPALEPLMYSRSYGYRRGRSRQGASLDIQAAWREGYRWVYEADIDDFFDNVDWAHLRTRLQALFRDDPAVELILAWVGAPVDYQGFRIERMRGLPQGAPLSPLLANLMLDDFDSDLESAGFRLVRFADDFVVLCRSREQAEAAGAAVRRSLEELGLTLNEDKSRAVAFEQGFRYLGYLFLNDMVLDVSGGKDEAPVRKPPPPNSWLARIGRREARPLDNSFALPKRREEVSEDFGGRLSLGERGNEGTLVIITGKSAFASTSGGRLIVSRDDETLIDCPWTGISALLLIGAHHVTTPALRAALGLSVPIHFASGFGKYQGTVWNGVPGAEGGALWLRQQTWLQDAERALPAARQVVMARIRHMREVLRQRRPTDFIKERNALQTAMKSAGTADDLAALNGVEGNATRTYFGALKALVPDEYGFSGRNRRPPRDPFNALLSLGYTLLYAHVETLVRVSGLYPWIGFYHQPHGTHATLASDLMEPFRHLIERIALTIVIRAELEPADFRMDDRLGCRLSPPALRRYMTRLVKRFDEPVHAVGDEAARPVLQHIHAQNRRLVSWLRGGAEFTAWVSR